MGLDLFRPARKETGDESIASFLRRRFGQEAVDRLGEPLLAGIHAGDPERLSIRASFPRFADLEMRYGSLIRGLWSATPRAKPGSSAFYSLAGGLGELVTALESRLASSSPASIYKDTEAQGLERSNGSFNLVAGSEPIRARAVILAVPPSRSAELLSGMAGSLARPLGEIRYSNTATVCVGYRREDVESALDGYGLIVPRSEGLRTMACGFFSTKFPGRAPAGHVLLRGFLGGARDPGVLELDDAALVDLVEREMSPVLGIRGRRVVARVFRWPQATPQLEVGHMERVAAIEGQIRDTPGLFVTGAGFRVTGIPDCVADGTASAAAAHAFLSR
jgi:oxygen-dependent protoporphyrinogen oxidase